MTSRVDKKRFGALIIALTAFMAMATAAFAGTATDKTLGYREYTVYEPSIKYTSSLILAMHPGLSYSSAWRNALPTDPVPGLDNTMDVIADETGTTVVYPQGYYFAWNSKSPRCCGYTSDINVPDIDYLERVIADVAQDYDLDSTSVYFAGYSNGGMMSMSYACAHPEQVKGIVSASGPMMVDQDECPAFPTVPVTYIYGDSDTTVPPSGGHSAASNRIYPAAQEVIDFISASGADIDTIELTGATHDWDSIVSYLSSQEGGLSFASATELIVSNRLSLDFENGVYRSSGELKDFSDIITFTRSTTGTYVDADGVIQTASVGVPRFDYSTGRSGLLIEEARTNLFFPSTPDASWGGSSITWVSYTTTDTVAPDGTQTAGKVRPQAAGASHYTTISHNASFTSGTTYTLSIFVKAGAENKIQLSGTSAAFGSALYANFSLTGDGSVTASSGVTAGIEKVGTNGWYRIRITAAATATASGTPLVLFFIETPTDTRGHSFTAAGTETIYAWGGQTEVGAFPTSLIPTSGSTANRAADSASITGTNFSDWYNESEGTFVADVNIPNLGTFRNIVSAYLSNNDRILLQQRSSPEGTKFEVYAGGASQAAITVSGTVYNTDVKIAATYKANDFASVIGGGTVGSDTSGSVPTGLTSLNILAYGGGGTVSTGVIHNLTYYNTHLPNATLQELSQ